MTLLEVAQAGGDLFDNMESEEDDEPLVDIQEMLQLQNLGIASNHVTWTRVTMTSDSHICLKQRAEGKQSNNERALVLDLVSDKCIAVPLPPQAEQCMVNPVRNTPDTAPPNTPLLAVKAGMFLRVYEMTSQPIKEVCQREIPVTTEFWTWLDHSTIGIVTETTVLTWNPDVKGERGNKLEEVFTRNTRLDDAEIIALKADPDQQWFALVGLMPQVDEITGLTELYSRADQVTQCICAHTAAFSRYKFSDNQQASTVLVAAARDSQAGAAAKFHVVELGASRECSTPTCSFIEILPFPVDELHYDFPISIHVWSSAGLAFVLSKYGRLFVCDMETGTCLCAVLVAEDVVFTSALYSRGLLAISINGKVMRVEMRCDELVQHCELILKKPAIGQRLQRIFSTLANDNKANSKDDNKDSSGSKDDNSEVSSGSKDDNNKEVSSSSKDNNSMEDSSSKDDNKDSNDDNNKEDSSSKGRSRKDSSKKGSKKDKKSRSSSSSSRRKRTEVGEGTSK